MTEITMPKMSDTMEEGRVVRWLKHEGDSVSQGESIAEIETDKANVEMESFDAGVLGRIIVPEGETVAVGEPIAVIQKPGEAPAPTPQAPPKPAEAAPPPEAPVPVAEKVEAPEAERVHVSPLARKLASEHGVDLSKITGSGPGGRIVESDVEAFVKQPVPEAPPKPEAPPTPKLAPATEVPSEERELSRMRKVLGERLTRSKQTIPHFYVTSEIEMDWAARVREELNSDESQTRVSFTDIIIKACALALTKHPDVNSSFSDGKLIVHKQVNIGMAVALDEGLIAPVIHEADKKHLREIAARTKELAQRARDNSLHSSDYTGGTFTISNLGMFDVESFAAIINPPDCASLAVGTIREIPVVKDGQIVISKRMKATLSADHRVLDGATAAKFLHEVKANLESPTLLL